MKNPLNIMIGVILFTTTLILAVPTYFFLYSYPQQERQCLEKVKKDKPTKFSVFLKGYGNYTVEKRSKCLGSTYISGSNQMHFEINNDDKYFKLDDRQYITKTDILGYDIEGD